MENPSQETLLASLIGRVLVVERGVEVEGVAVGDGLWVVFSAEAETFNWGKC